MKAAKKPSGSGRLSAEQIAALNDRLLDAALELFTSDGYAGASIERIAKRAGASTKTIYSRFANKAEILQAVVNRTVSRILATHQAENAFEVRNAEPRKFLVTLGLGITRTLTYEGAGLNRLALSEAWRFPELARFYRATYAHGAALIADVLRQWQDAGLLPALANPAQAADICLGMFSDRTRVMSGLGVAVPDTEREAHVVTAVEIFLRSLGYAPKTRPG